MDLRTAKALVRPVVTIGLVATQAILAVAWAFGVVAADAFAALGPFTMMAMTFWFRSRESTE